MPILRREDGTKFAVQTYRELLTFKKSSLLRNEVRILAQDHGEYIRIFVQTNKQLEAVFSSEPGYLLAESVWYYVGKPTNMLYCEALAAKQVIVVVVRNSIIYLDAVLPNNEVVGELSSLIADQYKYDIYLFGNVPVSDVEEENKFFLHPQLIKSLNRPTESLFAALPVFKNLELQPLALALTIPELSKRSLALPIGIGVTGLIILGIWYYATRPAVQPMQPIVQQVRIDPYALYKAAFVTPAPEKQLGEIAAVTKLVYALPGWQATQINYNDSIYQITVTSLGGSTKSIIQWANENHFGIDLTPAGATLTVNSNLAKRSQPTYIYDVQQVTSLILDRLKNILPDRNVTIGNVTPNVGYKTVPVTIAFTGISPDVLVLIGRQLANLPVTLSSITIGIQQAGLLNGTIQLTALGS
ncbi:MAG: hypothetical protein WBE18_04960 [Gammaproteobacteria bacterium]